MNSPVRTTSLDDTSSTAAAASSSSSGPRRASRLAAQLLINTFKNSSHYKFYRGMTAIHERSKDDPVTPTLPESTFGVNEEHFWSDFMDIQITAWDGDVQNWRDLQMSGNQENLMPLYDPNLDVLAVEDDEKQTQE